MHGAGTLVLYAAVFQSDPIHGHEKASVAQFDKRQREAASEAADTFKARLRYLLEPKGQKLIEPGGLGALDDGGSEG